MRLRAVVVCGLAAGLLLAYGQVAVANVTWCVSDPPVQVVTAGGTHLTVNNMVYLPVEDKALAKQIADEASTAPDGHGGTLITVHVSIPLAAHGANVISINQRYRVTDTKSTPVGGSVLTLVLDVPTS
jgi:hypothetical protein